MLYEDALKQVTAEYLQETIDDTATLVKVTLANIEITVKALDAAENTIETEESAALETRLSRAEALLTQAYIFLTCPHYGGTVDVKR